VQIPRGHSNRTGAPSDGQSWPGFLGKLLVYSVVRVGRRTLVFKMLVLLGFLADVAGPFIHSDIHRGLVRLEDYAAYRVWVSRTFLRLGRPHMGARNTLFSTNLLHRLRKFQAFVWAVWKDAPPPFAS